MAFCEKCGAPVDSQFCSKCGARVGAGHPVNIPAGPQPGPQAPKKRSPILWILLGCFGLIVIAGVVMVSTGLFVAYKAKQAGLDPALIKKSPALAVAKMIVAANPDVELLSVDEDHAIMKVRDKKTGKTLTVNLEEAKSGKIVFLDENNQRVELQAKEEGDSASLEVRSPEGTMSMGAGAEKLPDWLPAYPGAKGTGTFGMNSKEGKAGSYAFKTGDTLDDVVKFYEDALKAVGLEVEKTTNQAAGQGSMIILAGKDGASDKTAQVIATSKGEGTEVNLTFSSKK